MPGDAAKTHEKKKIDKNLTQQLSIADVVDKQDLSWANTKESLLAILQALPISEYETRINNETVKSGIDESKGRVENVFARFRDVLNRTNSKRLNTSTEAVNSEKKLQTISAKVDGLEEAVDNYLKEDVIAKIEEYNEKLKELKRGAKIKLLRMEADRINELAKAGTGYPHDGKQNVHYEGENSPPSDRQIDKNTWRHYNSREPYQVDYWPPTNATRSTTPQKITKYKGTYTDLKYINYWGTINSIDKWYDCKLFNWQDDDVNELEARFIELKLDLPYNPDEIYSEYASAKGIEHVGGVGKF